MTSSPKPTFPWLIVPPAATLILFFGVPLALVFAVSFASRGTYGGIEWTLTLGNYTSIADPLYLRIFWRSLWLAVLTTVICLLMVLPLYAALERLDPALIEAAWDLYARPLQVFTRVVLPLSKPGVIAGCVLVFIPSLGAYVTPDLLGGARSMMIGNLIQHQYLVVRDWPFGSALSFVLMAGVLAAVLYYLRAGGARSL